MNTNLDCVLLVPTEYRHLAFSPLLKTIYEILPHQLPDDPIEIMVLCHHACPKHNDVAKSVVKCLSCETGTMVRTSKRRGRISDEGIVVLVQCNVCGENKGDNGQL